MSFLAELEKYLLMSAETSVVKARKEKKRENFVKNEQRSKQVKIQRNSTRTTSSIKGLLFGPCSDDFV